jgi:hypothetical protein
MRRNLLPALALLAAPLAVLAAPMAPGGGLQAQSIDSPYRFIDGRHDAIVYLADVPGNRGTMQIGPGGGTLFGARYGIELSGPFALEFGGFLLPTDRRVRTTRATEDQGTIIEEVGVADITVGALETRLRFTLTGPRTWYRLAPYLSAGGGMAQGFTSRIEEELEFSSEARSDFGLTFLGTVGAGTRFFLTDQLSLRADVTIHYWKQGTPETFRNVNQEVTGPIVDQEWPAVRGYSVGLSWRF